LPGGSRGLGDVYKRQIQLALSLLAFLAVLAGLLLALHRRQIAAVGS
jgi:hypothetical protein